MRAARFVVAVVAALMAALVVSTPAHAVDVNLSLTSVTYVPNMTTPGIVPTAYVRLTLPNQGIKIHVTTTVPGGVYTLYSAGGGIYCSADNDESFTCITTASPAADAASIQVLYRASGIVSALGQKASADYTTTATVVATGETATSQFHVRPKADWRYGGAGIRGVRTEFVLWFNAVNFGPSGGSTRVTVTGFRTRSSNALPSGCKWSGALTVTCSYSGAVNENMSGQAEIPIVTDERGCAYKVTVEGIYADPQPSNNTRPSTPRCHAKRPAVRCQRRRPLGPAGRPDELVGRLFDGVTSLDRLGRPSLRDRGEWQSPPRLSATGTAGAVVAEIDSTVVAGGPVATAGANAADDGSQGGGHDGLIFGLVIGLMTIAAGTVPHLIRRRAEPSPL